MTQFIKSFFVICFSEASDAEFFLAPLPGGNRILCCRDRASYHNEVAAEIPCSGGGGDTLLISLVAFGKADTRCHGEKRGPT